MASQKEVLIKVGPFLNFGLTQPSQAKIWGGLIPLKGINLPKENSQMGGPKKEWKKPRF